MTSSLRWTSTDLDALPDDGKRYEIIDGELFVSKQPHFYHQHVCGKIYGSLENWREILLPLLEINQPRRKQIFMLGYSARR